MKEMDKIEQYITGKMIPKERIAFENEMKTDPELGLHVKEFEFTLQNLQKQWIQNSWKKAEKKYTLIKNAAMLAGVVLVGTLLLFTARFVAQKQTKLPKTDEKNSALAANNAQMQLVNLASTQKLDSVFQTAEVKTINVPAGTPACRIKSLQTDNVVVNIVKASNLTRTANTNVFSTNTFAEIDAVTLIKFEKLNKGNLLENNNVSSFIIQNHQDNLLDCKDNFKVFIPKNILVDSACRAVTGDLEIVITKFLTPFDLFKHGISTNSNEGILQTGGSCLIKAYQNGKELKIAPDKEIVIQFPSVYEPEMKAFYAKNDKVNFNWTSTALDNSVVSQVSDSLSNGDFKFIDNVNSMPKVFTKIKKEKSRGMFLDVESDDITNRYYFDLQVYTNEANDQIAKEILDNRLNKAGFRYFNEFKTFNRKLAYDMYEKGNGDSLVIHYNIDSSGVLSEYKIQKNTKSVYRSRLKNFVKSKGKAQVLEGYRIAEYNFTLVLKPNRVVSNSISNQKINDVSKSLPDSLKKAFADQAKLVNVIAASSLGYINCDRFTNMTSASSQFVSKYNMGFVYAYFPRIKSVLKLNLNASMKVIPNEKLTLVACMPTKDGLLMCIKENQKAGPLVFVDGDFVPFDEKTIALVLQ